MDGNLQIGAAYDVLAGGTGRGRLDPSAGTRPSRVRDAMPDMDRRGASEPEVVRQPESPD